MKKFFTQFRSIYPSPQIETPPKKLDSNHSFSVCFWFYMKIFLYCYCCNNVIFLNYFLQHVQKYFILLKKGYLTYITVLNQLRWADFLYLRDIFICLMFLMIFFGIYLMIARLWETIFRGAIQVLSLRCPNNSIYPI